MSREQVDRLQLAVNQAAEKAGVMGTAFPVSLASKDGVPMHFTVMLGVLGEYAVDWLPSTVENALGWVAEESVRRLGRARTEGVVHDVGMQPPPGVVYRQPVTKPAPDPERRVSPDVLKDLDGFCSLLERHGIRVGLRKNGAKLLLAFPDGSSASLSALSLNMAEPAVLVPEVLALALLTAPEPGQEPKGPFINGLAMAEWIAASLGANEGIVLHPDAVMRVFALEAEYLEQLGEPEEPEAEA